MKNEFFHRKTKDEKSQNSKDEIFFDLAGYTKSKLIRSGVEDITFASNCTYSNEDLYPSYRRAKQNNKSCSKRILSIIYIY